MTATAKTETPIPLRDNVLFRSEKEMTTAGGLIMPESAMANCAILIAVGPGTDDCSTAALKPGLRVLLDAPEGTVGKFHWGSVQYHMTSARYVAAILPDVERPRLVAVK